MPKAAKKHTTTKKTGTAPDPILKLIATAEDRIVDFRNAHAKYAAIRQKIGESNSTYPEIRGPDDIFRRLFSTLSFRSIAEIEYASKRAASAWRRIIRKESGLIRSGNLSAAQVRVARSNIAEAKIRLAEIPVARTWAIREWRREMARLRRCWRSSGFDKARARRSAALFKKLAAVRAVHKAKPQTVEGCVALLKFVADSSMRDLGSDPEREVKAPLYRIRDALKLIDAKRS